MDTQENIEARDLAERNELDRATKEVVKIVFKYIGENIDEIVKGIGENADKNVAETFAKTLVPLMFRALKENNVIIEKDAFVSKYAYQVLDQLTNTFQTTGQYLFNSAIEKKFGAPMEKITFKQLDDILMEGVSTETTAPGTTQA